MTTLLRDALRQVVRSRRFTVAAALCAALGIAAFGAVGALLDAAFVAPLPFRDADRLVRVWMEDPATERYLDLSFPEATAVIDEVRSFDSVAASARVRIVGQFADGAARMRGEAVSPDYFTTLGLRPALGRLIAVAERSEPVALLSHALWRSRFGSDPAVVGKTLSTAQGPFVVIGVMPAWFHGAIEADEVELWVPFDFAGTIEERADRQRRHLWLTGRLRDGATAESARAELAALTVAARATDPTLAPDWALATEPFGANWRGPLRKSSGLLGVAAAGLLVVAIANAAALLAVRARARRHELALRSALGASPKRLARQLLVESLLVLGAGGFAGLASAWPLLRLFLAANPGQLPPYVEVAPNFLALAIGLLLTLALGTIAGTVPALEALGARPLDALRAGGRSAIGDRRSASRGLVALQLAATLVLLAGATLVLRSYAQLATAPLGFDVAPILRTAVTLSASDAPRASDPAATVANLSSALLRVRESIARVPGITSVGLMTPTLPPWDPWRARLANLPGADGRELAVGGHAIDEALLATMGIDLETGRGPTADEVVRGARVAVVSRSLALRMLGADASGAATSARVEGALGRALRFSPGDDVEGEVTVIGVAEDVLWAGHVDQDTQRLIPRGAFRADLYVPLGLAPSRQVSIAVRTDGRPSTTAAASEPAVRKAIAAAAPSSPIHWTSTMSDELGAELRPTRFLALLVDAFAIAALLVAGAGLFAFLSTAVLSRRRELGLRGALGASRVALAGLVTREAAQLLLPAAVAAAIGLALLQPALRAVLHEVAPSDPAALAGAVAALLLVALAALILPLRTALRLDPAAVLRDE